PGIDPALLDRTMLVFDPRRDRRWTRADGFAEIFAALPLGRLWIWPMRLPGLRALCNRLYDAFARNRTRISTFFGLAACGVPSAPRAAAPAETETPLRGWFRAQGPFVRDVPLTDETVYVDAVTRDGRHVDPYNEIGSRVADIPIDSVPVRLGHDSFWCDYTLRIPDAGVYHQAFIEWLLRYPDRTGNPNDTITSFDAYVVQQD